MIDTIKPLFLSLARFSKERMGFNEPPRLFLKSCKHNSKNALGKTAYYDPSEKSITIFIHNRHPKDILRSFAHELVHHCQNLRGDLSNTGSLGKNYAQDNSHMRNMEKEAYLQGNMCFRDWEDSLDNKTQYKITIAERQFLKENKDMSVKISKNALKGLIKKLVSEKLEKQKQVVSEQDPSSRLTSLPKDALKPLKRPMITTPEPKPREISFDDPARSVKKIEDIIAGLRGPRPDIDAKNRKNYPGVVFTGMTTDPKKLDIARKEIMKHLQVIEKDPLVSINIPRSTLDALALGSTGFERAVAGMSSVKIIDKKKDTMVAPTEEPLEEDDAFGASHYCIHHGGVNHNGSIAMAEAIQHVAPDANGFISHYDMKLADGTILENVAAEDIQVTNASLAQEHSMKRDTHKAYKRDKVEELEEGEGVKMVPKDKVSDDDKVVVPDGPGDLVGVQKESKIQTPEQEEMLYESRFGKRDEEVFSKLTKLWTK